MTSLASARLSEAMGAPAQPWAPPTRRRFHPTLPGAAYATVTLCLGAGALNSQNNLLFLAFGGAIGVLLVSGLLSGSMLMAVQARREQVEPAPVGRALVVRYTIRNASRFIPVFAVTVGETSGARATWPLRIGRPLAFIAYLGPGREAVVDAPGLAMRRGEIAFDRFRIWSSFPFGVATKSVEFRAPALGLVRPEPIEPPALDLAAVREDARRASASSAAHAGAGDEFLSLREYVPGDSMRRIAWRASARRGELVVREHAAPGEGDLWIHLDLLPSPSADEVEAERLQEIAIGMAAHVVETSTAARTRVGLAVPAAGVWIAPRHAGAAGSRAADLRSRDDMLDALARIDLAALDTSRAQPRAWPAGAGVVRVDAGAGPGHGAAGVNAADIIASRGAPA